MPNPTFDTHTAHRRFAVELNNNLWRALERRRWSADDAEQNIHAAHASAITGWKWATSATTPSRVSAANVLRQGSLGESALAPARRCQELLEDSPYAFEDWDFAFASRRISSNMA